MSREEDTSRTLVPLHHQEPCRLGQLCCGGSLVEEEFKLEAGDSRGPVQEASFKELTNGVNAIRVDMARRK